MGLPGNRRTREAEQRRGDSRFKIPPDALGEEEEKKKKGSFRLLRGVLKESGKPGCPGKGQENADRYL